LFRCKNRNITLNEKTILNKEKYVLIEEFSCPKGPKDAWTGVFTVLHKASNASVMAHVNLQPSN